MARAIALCEPQLSVKLVHSLKSIDYMSDLDRLEGWLRAMWKKPPPVRINGPWFGIFERALGRGGGSAWELHVAGSARFDPKDKGFRWAVRPEWFPPGRYPDSWTLKEMSEVLLWLGHHDEEQVMSAGYVIAAAADVVRRIGHERMKSGRKELGIAAGHDSGGGWLIRI